MESKQDEELINLVQGANESAIDAPKDFLQSKNAAPNPESKRQQKRRAREQLWNQHKEKKREEKKLKIKEQKMKWREQLKSKTAIPGAQGESGKLIEEEEKKEGTSNVNFKKKTQEKKLKYKEMVTKGQGIIIDCSFQDVMTRKELNSLCNQLGYCQSTNKDFPIPSKLTLSSFRNRVKERLSRLGALNWGIVLLENITRSIFRVMILVYLTGDAEEEIEELDPELINGQPMPQALKESIPTRKVEEYLKQAEEGGDSDDDGDGGDDNDELESNSEKDKPGETATDQQQDIQANGDKQ